MERNIEKLYEIIESQQIKIDRMEKQLLEFKERYEVIKDVLIVK